jgi:2-polyprenyl-3-methyl-5-hydroxy-6-metoxy-1,4-benzoquinol methylase
MSDATARTSDAHADSAIHQKWVANYRTPDMQAFYEMAFDMIARHLNAPADSAILDAGCGTCAKSVLLAARGFRVTASDYSSNALELAADTVAAQGFADRIAMQQENLLKLSFPDGAFQYVLCWGVLMHIPDLQRALSELARVVRPGGMLVLSEGNMYSIQAVALRWLKRLLRRERAEIVRVAGGIEYTETTGQGTLLTRQTDIPWLIAECERLGLRLKTRAPGQFTELYVAVPWRPIKRLIHAFNSLWFRYVKMAKPAFGNILILEKPK